MGKNYSNYTGDNPKKLKLKERELAPWKRAGIYGTVCSCGCRLPHDGKRVLEEIRYKPTVCFGPTHPDIIRTPDFVLLTK